MHYGGSILAKVMYLNFCQGVQTTCNIPRLLMDTGYSCLGVKAGGLYHSPLARANVENMH